MHQHALNSILEGDSAGIASTTGTSQPEMHIALVIKTSKIYVAAILLDSWSNSCLKKLLDHTNNLTVVFVVRKAILLLDRAGLAIPAFGDSDYLLTCSDGFCDEGKDLRSNMCPIGICSLRNSNKIGAVENRRNSIDIHKLGSEWRRIRRRNGCSGVEILDKRRRELLGHNSMIR
ncbi:hypothetical protein FOQG_03282 [Fusarium oxysporum f. sp. raphani 54005]|uniref:Uncharacterized protein n=1 Tax=Fusarium oxysporum f. sp. raphani 54005 TaxID=1089458 RepID=X0CXY5_FUSOX|nr:hypothetical protein FOQG_03282 [Fusarium oxysporum f. sp. raphani 54005]